MTEERLGKGIKSSRETEVLVIGAGPAGMCAAVAAARSGAKTLLVDKNGVPGGNLTLGYVGPVMGKVCGGTLADEVAQLLGVYDKFEVHFDSERAKIRLCGWLDGQENLSLLLGCTLTEVTRDGSAVTGAVFSHAGGGIAVSARQIVDCTGDGTAAYLAGARYEIGRARDGLVQPVSLMFTLSGVDEAIAGVCRHEEDDFAIPQGSYLQTVAQANKDGILPASVGIIRLYRSVIPGERMVNAVQANGVDPLDAEQMTRAELDLRVQEQCVIDYLRQKIPGFQNARIKGSSSVTGVRESRRITGDYILTGDDLLSGRKFADAAVHNAEFCIDIHNPEGTGQAEAEGCPPRVKPYDIPYRCLTPQGVDNLLTAGRCVSGTHRAHASYRVMTICMATGQAAGTAAAICAAEGISPHSLNAERLREALIASGVKLLE
ncbi:MAG: FAD-dependent oxidoreductase [Clostridiales bacterium]|jgi:hypothetical protein|nr:FAD-dependent oxidoreductase [Clostridiales bacterium]